MAEKQKHGNNGGMDDGRDADSPRVPSESEYSDQDFRAVFGVSRRQAERISDFAVRRAESKQYEKLGRAVVKKVLYLVGAVLVALGYYFLGDYGRVILKALVGG